MEDGDFDNDDENDKDSVENRRRYNKSNNGVLAKRFYTLKSALTVEIRKPTEQ